MGLLAAGREVRESGTFGYMDTIMRGADLGIDCAELWLKLEHLQLGDVLWGLFSMAALVRAAEFQQGSA